MSETQFPIGFGHTVSFHKTRLCFQLDIKNNMLCSSHGYVSYWFFRGYEAGNIFYRISKETYDILDRDISQYLFHDGVWPETSRQKKYRIILPNALCQAWKGFCNI
jgi:hypothetical protein